MVSEHLNDDEIQNYLDNRGKINRSLMEAHLNGCEKCQAVYTGYKAVFQGLEYEPPESLSADFVENVLANIPVKPKYVRAYGILSAAAVAVLLIGGLAVTQQYIDLVPVGKNVAHSLMPAIDLQAPELLAGDFNALSSLRKYDLWLLAGFAIFAVTIIDQIISKKRSMQDKLLSLIAF